MDVQITRPLQRAVHRDLICQCLFLCGDLHPSNTSTSLHPSLHLDHFSRCEGLADRDQQTDRHTDHATLSVAISCIQLVLQCDLNAIQANNAKHSNYLNRQTEYDKTHAHTPFNGPLSGTTRVGRYQKKHSPTHTHSDRQTSFISFLHLLRSIASSLIKLHA